MYGVNVGAQSYWDALATMIGHTRGALIMTPDASMVLTGRAALEASGGVAAEDEVAIGGFERIMGPNGEAQYYAGDLAAACEASARFCEDVGVRQRRPPSPALSPSGLTLATRNGDSRPPPSHAQAR